MNARAKVCGCGVCVCVCQEYVQFERIDAFSLGTLMMRGRRKPLTVRPPPTPSSSPAQRCEEERLAAIFAAGAHLQAARVGDGFTIKRLLVTERNSVDIDKALDDGGTPLFMASQEGHGEVARLLIEAGADILAQGRPS